MKKQEADQWISSFMIGILGGLTLFFVNIALNKFVFHVYTDWPRTILTAIIFTVVFAVVSRQWDKKKDTRPNLKNLLKNLRSGSSQNSDSRA